MRLLTDEYVKKIPPVFEPTFHPDGNNLVLVVYPDKTKMWLHDAKEGSIILGKYPKMKVNDARDLNEALAEVIDSKILTKSALKEMCTKSFEATDRFGSGESLYVFHAHKQAKKEASIRPLKPLRKKEVSLKPDPEPAAKGGIWGS